MIKTWFVTGDTHGQVEPRLRAILDNNPHIVSKETAVIILGDAGINFYLNKTDYKNKQRISATGLCVYCVRGNHEARPENIPGMRLVYDDNVRGYVYTEDEFPEIRYLMDGGEYIINNKSVLVIGGAYSVDKYYRLARTVAGEFSGWFADEQLTEDEMKRIGSDIAGKHFDFVFTHTTPIDWEPTDLFLSGIDQSAVDKTMENWLGLIKDTFTWGIWCFGHYHDDRIEAPHVEQFYNIFENIDAIVDRWNRYDETGELDWWLRRSPRMR